MITYIRTGPMPICKHCKKRMDYWIFGMLDQDHAHTECEAKASVDSIMREFASALNKNRPKRIEP